MLRIRVAFERWWPQTLIRTADHKLYCEALWFIGCLVLSYPTDISPHPLFCTACFVFYSVLTMQTNQQRAFNWSWRPICPCFSHTESLFKSLGCVDAARSDFMFWFAGQRPMPRPADCSFLYTLSSFDSSTQISGCDSPQQFLSFAHTRAVYSVSHKPQCTWTHTHTQYLFCSSLSTYLAGGTVLGSIRKKMGRAKKIYKGK